MSILALGRKQKKKKKGEKRRKFPIKKSEESRRKKIPNQGSEENKRNVQKGLWTRQYLNNTELSPSKQKKGLQITKTNQFKTLQL